MTYNVLLFKFSDRDTYIATIERKKSGLFEYWDYNSNSWCLGAARCWFPQSMLGEKLDEFGKLYKYKNITLTVRNLCPFT